MRLETKGGTKSSTENFGKEVFIAQCTGNSGKYFMSLAVGWGMKGDDIIRCAICNNRP